MKKKPLKRLLVLAVSAAMVFGTCGTSPAAAGRITAAAADTLEQDSEGYYLITSGADMDTFAQIVLSDTDANARLTQDITLTSDFVPIGTAGLLTSTTVPSYPYAGTFDGQGHTISGLSISGDYYYLGLFACVTTGCVLKDFTVEGSVTGLGYLSGVVAYAAKNATIQNVTSNVNVTSISADYTGGIIAYSVMFYEVDILACENNGTITSAGKYAGGIGGYLRATSHIIGCRNTGDIEAASYAGGIVGSDYNISITSLSQQSQFIGCANTGDVTTTASETTSFAGGILGYTYGIVQYCFNTGRITAGGTALSYNGGIVGYLGGAGSSIKAIVDSCFNAGSFDNSTGYFGGIVGAAQTSDTAVIKNCYNTADIGSSDIARAGGIADYINYLASIENCYNIGTITASSNAGEIAAYPSSSAYELSNISNCCYLSDSSNGASGRGNTVSGAVSVDSDTLKGYAQTLGDAYKTDSNSINDGYPILSYQDMTVKEVKALLKAIDPDTSDEEDIGYAYAAYYCLSDKDQEKAADATADTLTVTKEVADTDTNGYALSADLSSSISDLSYTFALYKADDEEGTNAAAVASVSYVVEDASGSVTEYVTGTDGSFTLKDGETATFGGNYTATLGSAIDMDTAGYYYVTEVDTAENFETSWTQTTNVSGASVEDVTGRTSSYVPVSGGSDTIDEVTFDCTNTYVQDVVSVSKIISDAYVSSALYDALNAEDYTFTLTKTENGTASAAANVSYTVYEDGIAGDTLTTDGNGSFTLTGGQTARFIDVDLDAAVTYSVEETALTGNWTTAWTAASSVSDASIGEDGTSVTVTGSVSAADTVDFTCTNTYLADTLTVTKTVSDTSAAGDALSDTMKSYLDSQSFSFTLYMSGTAAAGESYSVYEGETLVSTGNATGTDGSFTLSGGQTACFESLDMTGECSYSVTENDLEDSLWTCAWSCVSSASAEAVTSDTASSGSVSLTGTASSADTIAFTCTNTYAYDSILLYTPDDLAAFSGIVADGYSPDATVMADIDATGTASDGSTFAPIGGSLGSSDATVYPVAYTGTFDGNDKTITLAMSNSGYYFTGLFGSLGSDGVIQDLTLEGSVTGGYYTGGTAAVTFGGTIKNVTSYLQVTSTVQYAGGIAGCHVSGALTIEDCANYGTVSCADSGTDTAAAGIIAYAAAAGSYADPSITIAGCENHGTVTGTNYTAGIIAYLYTSSGNVSSVTDCVNDAAVSGTGYTGGIAGSWTQAYSLIDGCTNAGSVMGTSADVGGVVGECNGSGAEITSCFNTGAVAGSYNVGGIAGYLYFASLQYSGNSGTVLSTGNDFGFSGGVAGYLGGSGGTINSCYNRGNVSGSTSNGGVVGQINGSSKYSTVVTNCYNTGDISSSSSYVGGVAAYLYYKTTLQNCYSAGEISSTADTTYVGGVAARMSSVTAPTAISNNYALDTVDSVVGLHGSNVSEDMMQLVDSDTLKTYADTSTDDDGNTTTSVLGTAYKEDTTSVNSGYPILDWENYNYEASWVWAEDYSTATLILTSTDGDETLTVEAAVTSEVTTAATCTAAGVRTYTATAACQGVNYTDTQTESIEKTAHSYEAVVTEPTCTEGGCTTYTCSVCGDSYTADETQATGHSYETVVTEPTCTEDGYTTYTCSVCGDTYTADETQATGHSYEAVVTEPTCTEGGYTTYTCSVCGDSYMADETQATGHSYEAVVTEPTCTEGGYTTYTCSVCGDSYTADETQATGHSYGSDGCCTVCGDYSAEAAAAAVIELIDAIGDVTTESGDTIAAARAAYNALLASDPEAAALVTNADTLTEAEETYAALTAEDDTDGGTSGGGTTGGSSYTVPSSKIAAEKVSLTGATVAQVTQTLAKLTNDGDLADSTYYLLQAKAKKTTKKSVKLSWKKVSGAKSYVVYANACGKGKKLKKYKVKSKTSLNITKIAGKKLTSGKYYKFLVIALDADGKVIQTSKVIHAATKGGSVTNAKSVTLYKSGKKVSSLTLKKGKSAKITAKVTKQDKKKKIQTHRKTKYESSNKKIATVTANGKIKARAKGTCYIYAYAQNGVCKRMKVTVK